jgi:hypothetical protein
MDGGIAVLFSSPIQEADLPEDSTLRVSPGIFQARVPKAFELRVTAIGQHLFAAQLDSQSIPAAALDWRAAATEVPVRPYSLPAHIADSCHRIMADLELVFGCFDIIVTPDGEYVFLEINEMGAFLWVEEFNPEFRMLDAFCELLIQRTPNFTWESSKATVRFEDVREEAVRLKQQASTIHAGSPVETVADNPFL